MVNSEFISTQLGRFFALATRIMGDQASHLMDGVLLLSLELADKITPDQEKRFRKAMTTARFLRMEIIDTWAYDIVQLLCQPTQIMWDEVNVYSEIQRAIEHTKWFKGELSKLVTVDATDEIFAYSIGSLLTQAISHLLIWVHLLAPSNPIHIGLTQAETEIILRLSGRGLSSSQIDFIEEEACYFFKGSAEFIISVLGGSFSWKADEIIPSEDELMVHFPRKPMR